ncbi:MAG: hypothetical protein ACF8XB_22645 [Planctomycetota bacterium JB042]
MTSNDVVFGGTEFERFAIEVRGYSYPTRTDESDGNWLNCRASVAAGGFRGSVECSLRAEDFEALERSLSKLLDEPRGRAEFTTDEEQVAFRIEGDGLGHFEVHGEVVEQPGVGNRLRWRIEVDRSQVAAALRQVRAIKAAVPVRRV